MAVIIISSESGLTSPTPPSTFGNLFVDSDNSNSLSLKSSTASITAVGAGGGGGGLGGNMVGNMDTGNYNLTFEDDAIFGTDYVGGLSIYGNTDGGYVTFNDGIRSGDYIKVYDTGAKINTNGGSEASISASGSYLSLTSGASISVKPDDIKITTSLNTRGLYVNPTYVGLSSPNNSYFLRLKVGSGIEMSVNGKSGLLTNEGSYLYLL